MKKDLYDKVFLEMSEIGDFRLSSKMRSIFEMLKNTLRTLVRGVFDKVKRCKNPYGDGRSAQRIVNVLKRVQLTNELIKKRFVEK